MRSKFYLRTFTSLLLLCIGLSLHAQKSLNHYTNSELWKSALEQFESKNYGVARHEFSEFIKRETRVSSDRAIQAEYYKALCAVELFRPDAEEEMKAFIRKHPESNKIQSAYFQLGRQQYRNKKYNSALVWFEQVDPYQLHHRDLTEFHFKMGYSYFKRNELESARKHFYEIIEVSGDYNAPANYYYAHIAYMNKNYQTALKGLKKLEGNKTFAPIVPYYITQIYYLQEKYQQLLEYAPQFIDDASVKRGAEISKMVGLAHYQMKEYGKAIPYLKKGEKSMIREDRFAYGYCFYKQEEYANAIMQFEKVGGKDDEMLQVANFCLADCYLKEGNKKGAKAAFASTARMDFDKNMQQDALFNFAKLTYELSYSPFNETIKAFDEYLQKYPDSDRNDEAYDYLVKVYMTTKNYGEALTSMDKIKNKTPQIERAYQRVAWLRGLELVKQLKTLEAFHWFDASLKYKMYNSKIAAECLYWKAEVSYRMGEYDAAIALYNQFLLSPGSGTSQYFGKAYYNIAYAYFELDKYDEASDWFRKFVNQSSQMDAYVADANNRIGDCFFLNRNYAKAAEFYAKSAAAKRFDADYALYQQAFVFGLLNKNKEKADLLMELKNDWPTSDYSDDALYELARAKVRLNRQNEAINLYNELAEGYPQSSYAAKSLLQIGQLNYNKKKYKEAIKNYKKVVEKYPQSAEKRSAFIGLKNVYVDMNQVNKYFAFAEKHSEGGSVRASEKDSLSYISAERLYMSGETEKGTEALAGYLNDFPNGMFRLNAQFYKAYADLNLEKLDEALIGFEEVIAKPNNFFTEKALLAASQLNYRKSNFGKGKEQYARLKVVAENPENVNVAKIGYMRCLYELKEYAACIPAADEVIGMPKIQEEELREARYKKVKSNLALGKDNSAIKELELLSQEVQSVEGAEAKYLLAKVNFNANKYDEAEKVINQFIEMNSPHHFWLAESFLLLSDVYMKKDNVFDARYTLQSIVDNYGIKDDGIIEIAQQKLNQILAVEKQKEEQIQKQAEQVEFEGANNAKNQKLFDKEEVKNDSVGLDEERMMLEEMLKKEETKVE